MPTARHAGSTKTCDAPPHQRRGQKFLAHNLANPLDWLRCPDGSGPNAHSQLAWATAVQSNQILPGVLRHNVQGGTTSRCPRSTPGRILNVIRHG